MITVLLALVAAIAAADVAPAAPAPDYVTSPVWTLQPTADELAAAYPAAANGQAGRAVVECRVTAGGGLEMCHAIKQSPEGADFGAAAEAVVSGRLQMAPADRHGRSTAGRPVRIPIVWNAPASAVDPDPAWWDAKVKLKKPGPKFIPTALIDHPHWVSKPDSSEWKAAYPGSSGMRLEGGAMILCRVLADGGLTDCAVDVEAPIAMGFGEAALKLAASYRLSADQAAKGDGVKIWIRWPPRGRQYGYGSGRADTQGSHPRIPSSAATK